MLKKLFVPVTIFLFLACTFTFGRPYEKPRSREGPSSIDDEQQTVGHVYPVAGWDALVDNIRSHWQKQLKFSSEKELAAFANGLGKGGTASSTGGSRYRAPVEEITDFLTQVSENCGASPLLMSVDELTYLFDNWIEKPFVERTGEIWLYQINCSNLLAAYYKALPQISTGTEAKNPIQENKLKPEKETAKQEATEQKLDPVNNEEKKPASNFEPVPLPPATLTGFNPE